MSWDAPPPGEPEPQQPTPPHEPTQAHEPTPPYQPAQPFEPTQPHQPTPPYGPTQPFGAPAQPYGQPAPTYGQPPAQPYGQPAPPEQPTAPYPVYPAPYGQQSPQTQPTQPIGYGQAGPNDQPPPQWSQSPPGQYGQPGQPGQYGDPYFPPYPIYPTPQQPKRSRTGFYAALGIIAVVVAAGVALGVAVTSSKSGNGTPSALNSSIANALTSTAPTDTDTTSGTDASSTPGADASQSSHNVIAPTSAGPLHLLSNADTARRIATIRSGLSGNTAYLNPKIAFYTVGSGSSFSVWMLAESSTDVPAFQAGVNMLGDDAMAHQVAQGANMTDVTTESAGPLGGALLCGKLTINGGGFRVCEWVDDSSFGWVYFMPSVNDSDIVTYTLDLRSGAEQ